MVHDELHCGISDNQQHKQQPAANKPVSRGTTSYHRTKE